MANQTTKQERSTIDERAAELYAEHGRKQSSAVRALIAETGISLGRARGAVARAMLRANRPSGGHRG